MRSFRYFLLGPAAPPDPQVSADGWRGPSNYTFHCSR